MACFGVEFASGHQCPQQVPSQHDRHEVINNHRSGALERHGLNPRQLAETYPGLVYVSLTCYGSSGPWAHRGGFDMNASAASGLMTIEGTPAQPRLPITGLLNDYITGYLGAVGAAALAKRATEGGSWHVTVNLTRAAMWCGSLGLVDPALAGCDLARPAGPPHDLHRRHTAAPYRPAITRTWPDRQATDVIEVIVMTASLGQRPASSGSRLRALGRSARTLRNLYAEQADAWERFFRAGLPAQPGAQDSAAGPRVHVPAPRPAPDASPAKSR